MSRTMSEKILLQMSDLVGISALVTLSMLMLLTHDSLERRHTLGKAQDSSLFAQPVATQVPSTYSRGFSRMQLQPPLVVQILIPNHLAERMGSASR